jgi:hypothetical protein
MPRRAAIEAENAIYTAQIRAVYQHIPMVLAVNIVNSALVALVLASYMEQTRWWIFFGSVVALTAVRAAAWSCYYRRPPKNDLMGYLRNSRIRTLRATLGSFQYTIASRQYR